jgi:predicted DNA-binding transcriptional regulator YafY
MIYTNRPEIIERNGNILTFEWPLLQLEEYFKRFGKDAIILEPKSSRENMIKFYSEAYEHYSNN